MDEEFKRLYETARDRGLIEKAIDLWCPHIPTPKQEEFLELDCLEALFGGAAGGGKSDALLMGALQHVDKPGYSALVLRRTYADLALSGAIMDRSKEWLYGTGAKWNQQEKTWTFPSGARITFGYLDTERDKYRYQSSEFQYVAFDELTQFPENSYRYLLSRVRRPAGSNIPLRARSASNPGGVGHRWVFERFVEDERRGNCLFVSSLLSDNPHIDIEQYRKSLAQLDETTRQQLELGYWIQDSQGLVYKYKRGTNLISNLPDGEWTYVLGVDFGASQIEATSAFATWAFNRKDTSKVYLVETAKEAGLIVSTIADRIRELDDKYNYQRIVADQGALGKGYIEELKRRHQLPVWPSKKTDKLGFRKLFNGDLERGDILVCGDDCSEWIDEAENLMWDDAGIRSNGGYADHATDAALYGWREAKHFLYQEPNRLPKKGTREYYEKQAQEQEARALARIQNRQGDMLSGMFK